MHVRSSARIAAAPALAFALLAVHPASARPQGGLPAAPQVSPAAQQTGTPAPDSDIGWPRTFTKDGTTVVLHEPQVDSWKNHAQIKFRCAVEVSLSGTASPAWGVVAATADTSVDENDQLVTLTNIQVAAVRFPGTPDADAAALSAVVTSLLPSRPSLQVALSRVLAYMHNSPPPPPVAVSLQPPPIFYSSTPAILVNYIGQPQFRPVDGTSLMFAVNTNWTILMDVASSTYYLMLGKSWLSAPDPMNGPWSVATQLPASFSALPAGDQWKDVIAANPPQPLASAPTVFTSPQPAELIVTNGPPSYSPVDGTSLMYVSNPEMPVFLDVPSQTYYYLVAGRWFSAQSLSGPWSAASTNLPAEFSKIPPGSTMGFVLTSVPGTPQAKDAVLLAQVPHKATINVQGPTVNVTYEGTPNFQPIQGTTMQYAANTAYEVVNLNNQYYCCYQGVWFQAPAATGPWLVCTSVPQVIYTIPPSCPIYNCTYVKVYAATPTTVTVGYTSGYSGAYVAATGALMFGAGMLVGAAISSDNCCWSCCHTGYYSYGCASYYHYGCGSYCSAGHACYGPCGGAGWSAGYNSSTGNYYRAGAAYGPDGARWGGQAYNPWSNTYAQHTGGTNGYQSWGSSYAQQGSNWAQAGHESTARGGVGYADNSSGQWAEGAHSNALNSSVAKTSNGDVYAGHDGNVYRNSGSGWQTYDNGSWNDVQKPQSSSSSQSWQHPTSAPASSSAPSSSSSGWKNDWNSSDVQNAWNQHSSSSSSAARSGGTSGGTSGASGGGDGGWGSHDTQNGLNHDSWSRNWGNGGGSGSSGSGGWGGQNGGRSWGGGDSSSGGGFHGSGGGDGSGGAHGFSGSNGFSGFRGFGGGDGSRGGGFGGRFGGFRR